MKFPYPLLYIVLFLSFALFSPRSASAIGFSKIPANEKISAAGKGSALDQIGKDCEVYLDRAQVVTVQPQVEAVYLWVKVAPDLVARLKNVGLRVRRIGMVKRDGADQVVEDAEVKVSLVPFFTAPDYFELRISPEQPLIVSNGNPNAHWIEIVTPFAELTDGTTIVSLANNGQPFRIDSDYAKVIARAQTGVATGPWQRTAARTRDQLPELNPRGCPRYME